MKQSERYYEIDLLRGFACLSVVAFHYLSRGPRAGWMPGALFPAADAIARYGYLGVHLFFMISGFVILLSAQGATPRGFVASRIARLYPAFWVAVPVTALTVWLWGDGRFAVSVPDFLINLTMFAHWFHRPWVDGAYWSLAVELHFYIYVWLALRFRVLDRLEWLLAAWLVVSGINALRPMWPVEFWLDAKWAPFFVAGGTFFLIRTKGVGLVRLGLLLFSYVLCLLYAVREAREAAIEAGMVLFEPMVVVGAVSGFFMAFAAIALRWWQVKASPLVGFAGAMTYPVYLLHQNIGYVLYERFLAWVGSPLLGVVVVFLTVLVLAWNLHLQVERRLWWRLRSLLAGGGTPVVRPVH